MVCNCSHRWNTGRCRAGVYSIQPCTQVCNRKGTRLVIVTKRDLSEINKFREFLDLLDQRTLYFKMNNVDVSEVGGAYLAKGCYDAVYDN